MKTTYQHYDNHNMFGIIYNFAEQLQEALNLGANLTLKNNYQGIKHIVFTGMGGSAIAGDLVSLLSASTTSIPMLVSRTYTLPAWVNQDTLVICLSYSGNTQETLSSFADAQSKKATILGITSGGQLAQKLQTYGYDAIIIPSGLPPRASLGYLSIPLLFVMHKIGLMPKDFIRDIEQTIAQLKKHRIVWSAEGAENNPTEHIAKKIYQSYPLIYGEETRTSVVTRRLRSQLAENSKMLSGSHELPELDHNEIVGFHNNPELLKNFGVLWLLDKNIEPEMAKRLKITQEIINPLINYQISIKAEGNSFIERIFYLIHFCDWLSFWCAMLHKDDPTPVDQINRLKQLLTK